MTRPDDAIKARFLADLAASGIVLSPDRAEVAASDFLLLHRQMELIRGALPAEAPIPLRFVPGDA